MTIKAMMASNDLKENKALQRGGGKTPDVDIKKIKIYKGEDDYMSTLRKQRFTCNTKGILALGSSQIEGDK